MYEVGYCLVEQLFYLSFFLLLFITERLATLYDLVIEIKNKKKII